MRNEEPAGLTPLWLYPGLTIAAVIFAFYTARVCVWAAFWLQRVVCGRDSVYLTSHLIYSSLELAAFSAQLAAAQYLMASSLALAERDRGISFSLVFFSAAVAGLFFSRLVAVPGPETVPLSGLPAAVACLIGALGGIFQKENENLMVKVKFNPFARHG